MTRALLASLALLGIANLLRLRAEVLQPGSNEAKPSDALADPAQFLKQNDGNYNYLRGVHELRRRQAQYLTSEKWRDMYCQQLATITSFIGNDKEAIDTFDLRPPEKAETKKPDEPPSLSDYEPSDAREAILAWAEHRQVIMINEAHHVPMHREFTRSLLAKLYQKGFRYFAAETLADDSQLQSRGYPTFKTGYYTHEPVYAELVRTALRLGYQVVPYEAVGVASPYGSDDPAKLVNDRERQQAEHLRDRILRDDPRAKIVVHAGYAHISKKVQTWNIGGKSSEIKLMATRFRDLTGIDPLCIDQTSMTEHRTPELEHPTYRWAVEQHLIASRPIVLRSKGDGSSYVPASLRGTYDVLVYHPHSRYKDGRPDWLRSAGRHAHVIKAELHPPAESSYLVQAFYKGEDPEVAIPADQVEWRHGARPPTLMLMAGNDFSIRVVDADGKTLLRYETASQSK